MPSRPSQSIPLVVDGVLYLSFPFCRMVALEPETGEVGNETWLNDSWRDVTGANPTTCMGKDGKQFVAVAAGTTLLTYTLP